jgi:MFS family permease
MIIPVYLAEISSNLTRGRTGGESTAVTPLSSHPEADQAACATGLIPITLNVSLLFAAVFCKLLSEHSRGWQIAYAVGLIPAFFIMIGVWCAPESPRWLFVKKGRKSAERALRKLRNKSGERASRAARQLPALDVQWRARWQMWRRRWTRWRSASAASGCRMIRGPTCWDLRSGNRLTCFPCVRNVRLKF